MKWQWVFGVALSGWLASCGAVQDRGTDVVERVRQRLPELQGDLIRSYTFEYHNTLLVKTWDREAHKESYLLDVVGPAGEKAHFILNFGSAPELDRHFLYLRPAHRVLTDFDLIFSTSGQPEPYQQAFHQKVVPELVKVLFPLLIETCLPTARIQTQNQQAFLDTHLPALTSKTPSPEVQRESSGGYAMMRLGHVSSLTLFSGFTEPPETYCSLKNKSNIQRATESGDTFNISID